MRLPEFDCGCENRKEIMFTAGKLGLNEALLLAAYAGILATLIYVRRH